MAFFPDPSSITNGTCILSSRLWFPWRISITSGWFLKLSPIRTRSVSGCKRSSSESLIIKVVLTESLPRISEIPSIEKVITQVWSRPFSFHGKSNDITGIPKNGDALSAIVSPLQERRMASELAARKLRRTPLSVSFEIKKRAFTISASDPVSLPDPPP